ncbi:MAG: AAA family ATPase, partial [Candidatus Limnocylindrales bacterium]
MSFVGRERELALLARAVQRASDGEAIRVLVAGPAGMGSSSLLDAFAARLAATPEIVCVRGCAYKPLAGQPYAALAAALGSVLVALPDDRLVDVIAPAAHDLATLLPWLAPRLDALGVPREPPALESVALIGSRVLEGVIGTLERLAGDGIVVVALEDLHWSDPGTRRFVETLLGIEGRLPICLIATYHVDEINRRHPARLFIDRILESTGVDVMRLAPLASDDLAAICEELIGDRPAGSFVAALVEGSGGNPLMATQLMTAHARLEGMRLSDPFEEVLAARVDALPPGALRTVRLLAAARRPLPRAACLSIPMREGRLDRQAIEDALASGLAVEVDPAPGEGGT